MDNQGFNANGKNHPSQPGNVQPSYPSQPYGGQPSYPPPPSYGQQPQPGYVYPSSPPYNAADQSSAPPPQHPQQQQQVIVVGGQQSTPVFVAQTPAFVSMVGAIVMSCFVFWLCGIILGGIAFVLAMVGYSSASAGDTLGAIRLRNASYGVSIAGIVIGIITIAVIAGMTSTAYSRVASTPYCYYSSGYRYCY